MKEGRGTACDGEMEGVIYERADGRTSVQIFLRIFAFWHFVEYLETFF